MDGFIMKQNLPSYLYNGKNKNECVKCKNISKKNINLTPICIFDATRDSKF